MISLRNIIAKYNEMSLSGKYNRAYLEGYRQCIVDLQNGIVKWKVAQNVH